MKRNCAAKFLFQVKLAAPRVFTRGFTLDFTLRVVHGGGRRSHLHANRRLKASGHRVARQPGATPAFWQLRRHKPLPRSSSSLWGSPQAVLQPGDCMSRWSRCLFAGCGGATYVEAQVIVHGLAEISCAQEKTKGRGNAVLAREGAPSRMT